MNDAMGSWRPRRASEGGGWGRGREEAMVEAVIRWRGKASAMLVWAILVAGRRAPYQDKISPPVSELSILQTLHLLQKNQPSVALPPANVEDKMR